MPEDKPEEPETPPTEIPKAVIFGGKSVLKFKGTGKLTVRKIQTSPDADPELVDVAERVAREYKEKYGDGYVGRIPKAPLVLPDP